MFGNVTKISALPFFHTTVDRGFWKSTENTTSFSMFCRRGKRTWGSRIKVFRGAPTPSLYPMRIFCAHSRTAMAVFIPMFREEDRTLWCRKEKHERTFEVFIHPHTSLASSISKRQKNGRPLQPTHLVFGFKHANSRELFLIAAVPSAFSSPSFSWKVF